MDQQVAKEPQRKCQGKAIRRQQAKTHCRLNCNVKQNVRFPLKGTLPYTFSSFPPAILIIRSASLKLNKSCSMKDYLMKLSVKSARTERRRKAEK